ncbi:dolichyl-phosphate-mannose-protein mannosyltransferase [Larkinella arboricola]|uniref:Dolichyl-phosphate-mannose-protein mannosyltransferase n=1 Tax=Larkinella arboricola TaxID=643671 RepID=A0A327WLF6_LARAB|nr:glycosyltransferase family 39 protein [Larkinella arboricola]RAJ92125.1 dolichyl-phosphate-mannose-protein mannosyltransferase [Larkinella arboricola]
MTLIYLLTFALFVLYIGNTAAGISRRSLTEWLLVSFILFTGSIILTGFCLSALYQTASTPVWAISVFLTATVLRFAFGKLVHQKRWSAGRLIRERQETFGHWYRSLSVYLKVLFAVMLATLGIIAVTNLLLALLTPPNEWDSMTGHLNRVIQYIQRGTMRHFGGTNWNMDTYPKSVCTIQIYSFLITGRFENAFKLVHHLSYWMAIVAVFGISQRIGRNLSASFFAAICYALLPDFLMQAVTTETDIVLTAYMGSFIYFLFAYRESGTPVARDNRFLYLAGMAFGIAYGHKITFTLLLPSMFVIMIYTVFWAPTLSIFVDRLKYAVPAFVVGVCLWMLPTGYLKNIEVFGHPIGPPTALRHQSIERAGPLSNLFKQGSRNVIRYGYDHINLDGLRNTQWGLDLNIAMRKPLVKLEEVTKMRLDEETDFSIFPFVFSRRFEFYNANPYWGIIGFSLILPLVFLSLIGAMRSKAHFFLAIAFTLHFLALSYSAPYDPFKGRYFIETGLLGSLFLPLLFTNRWFRVQQPGRVVLKLYVGLVIGTGCLSALLTVFLNERCLPLPAYGRPSAFQSERMYMQMMFRPDSYVPYKRFDELVPENATVALGTINDDFEYPLYGKNLTRRLIAINPFEKGVQPIPKEADYLFFSKNVIKPQPGDLRLGTDTTMTHLIVPGEDYYLRKLK